jgi:F0F1-type ATP synthase assembly protein I
MRGAVAGMMLLGSVVLFGLLGVGIGLLLDVLVPALLAGLFLGFAAGTWAVATRFRDI